MTMALEFTDFGLSPDERVAQREKALASFTNVAQPAYQKKVGAERGQLISDVEGAVAKQAMQGQVGAASGVMGEAMQRAAQMVPQQGAEQDALNLQGANMQSDIMYSRQGAAVDKYATMTEEMKSQAADYIAKQAFDLGYQAKELALNRDGFIADKAMGQMYSDLQQGRISRQEVFDMQSKFKQQAQDLQQETEKMLTELNNQLKFDLQKGDIAAAKARLIRVTEIQKEAARKAAQASQFGAMLSGVFTVAGATAGFVASGGNPIGAIAGAKALEGIAGATNSQLNKG